MILVYQIVVLTNILINKKYLLNLKKNCFEHNYNNILFCP